jgi:hypothetical protein
MTYRKIGEALDMTPQHVARDVHRNRTGIKAFSEWREIGWKGIRLKYLLYRPDPDVF